MGWENGSGPYDQTRLCASSCMDECEDESGIADADGLYSDESISGPWHGDGSGNAVARDLLKGVERKVPAWPPRQQLRERATRLSDGTVFRTFIDANGAYTPPLKASHFDKLPWASADDVAGRKA